MLLNPFDNLQPAKEVLPNNVDRFLVCGMFTSNYAHKAHILEDSIKKFGLPYVLYEIPSIHSSISGSGKTNSEFNKPKFINFILRKYGLATFYMDVDCVIESAPNLIREIAEQAYDFAIFNWLSKERNDAYTPINLNESEANRFFRFSHAINFYSENQLRCSGAVQFWGNTRQAADLLSAWNQVIEKNPNVPDDTSLDFAHNTNFDKNIIKSYWLPKRYARYGFWIFDKPVINHPDIPDKETQWQDIKLKEGEFLVDAKSCQEKPAFFYIKPNTFLDTHKNEIVIFNNGMRLRIGKNTMPIYIGLNSI